MTTTAPIVPSTATDVPAVDVQPRRGYVVGGLVAAIAAAAAVILLGAVARTAGVDFELSAEGDVIPLPGLASATLMFSIVGLALATGLRRWAERPAATFVRVTVVLTAISLVPPFLYDADIATSLSLVALHLTAATIFIPVVARRLAT